MRLKILLVGFGKLAKGIFDQLQTEHYFDIFKRSELDEIQEGMGRCFVGNVADASSWQSLPIDYDVVVYCVSPGSRDVEAYRTAFVDGIEHCVQHFGDSYSTKVLFVSSTSVYAQGDGSWVDELSPAEGANDTARCLVEAENKLNESSIASAIVRFSGIYGAGRNRLLKMVKSGSATLSTSSDYTNRIHEVDCIGFLAHLIRRIAKGESLESCYLASDSRPATLNEVYQFISNRLDVQLDTGSANAERRSGNKRCSNQRMLGTGYALQFPSFVEGYGAALDAESSIETGAKPSEKIGN